VTDISKEETREFQSNGPSRIERVVLKLEVVTAVLEERIKSLPCAQTRANIKDLYNKRESDRRWLIGALFTALVSAAGTVIGLIIHQKGTP
jgi:hypothetical protein